MISSTATYSVERVRADFPILQETIQGAPLAYLDNAATAQKPRRMIEATVRLLEHNYANVHRGVHSLSQRATEQFEAVRDKVRVVLNARESREVVFTKGCTEGINLVAQSAMRPRLAPGDEILVTAMEHHSNFVPWQILAQQTGATLRAVPMTETGELDLEAFESLLGPRTKVFACVHVSNSIGTVNPVRDLVARARAAGAICLVDGAQAGPHLPVDVQAIGADFYTLSCHKMYAPTGVGILYGRAELLDAMEPYQAGGGMIRSVSLEGTTYADAPDRFEPGTPNIIGFIGYGATLDYLASLGGSAAPWTREDWVRAMNAIGTHEDAVAAYGRERLAAIPGLRMIGTAKSRASIISFVLDGVHAHDVGQVLDAAGVAVRVGHHCCQPTMRHFEVAATVRASLGLYNTREEIDQLADGLEQVRETFR